MNSTITPFENELPGDKLSDQIVTNVIVSFILMIIAQIIAIYLNSALIITTFRTYKKEYQYPYYPLLFLIILINIIFTFLTGLIIFLVIFDTDNEGIVNLIPIPILIATSHPTLIAILDFLLCLHRFSVIFWRSSFLSIRIRCWAPLFFAVILPFVLVVSIMATMYAGFQAKRVDIDESLELLVAVCFIIDLAIKGVLGVVTFIGYSAILCKSVRQRRKIGRSIDFTIIKQAFPIACFQFITSIIIIIIHIGLSNIAWGMIKVYIAKYLFTQLLCIVVPLSIIFGKRDRKKFGDLIICQRRRAQIGSTWTSENAA
ncbi:unnamed protein product [Caenorhabditis bovis]|uniref:Uncharacterized protein n=1 Tax=Caenorhabditis bovis TaxID=2654633 RepID=A0A8S1EQJ9_9PELO|nr:unnamed protein product [Caenorhabditis bovis]